MNTVWTVLSQLVTAGGALLAVVLTLRGQRRREHHRDIVAAYARTVRALEDYRRAMFALTALRLVDRTLKESGRTVTVDLVRAELDRNKVRVDSVEDVAGQLVQARAASHQARSELTEASATLALLGGPQAREMVDAATQACRDIRDADGFAALQDARQRAKRRAGEVLRFGEKTLGG